MHLIRVRLSGFRSAGAVPVEITFEKLTFLLGPNGTGKTAVLHALVRMFGSDAGLRRVVPGDFHVAHGEAAVVGTARTLWLEADFAFPELLDEPEEPHPTVPPHFAHMRLETAGDQPLVRFRLTAELDEDGEVSERFEHVLAVDEHGEPARTATVNRYDRRAIQVHYLPARRDPADHVSYATNTMLGRLLRAADWQQERSAVTTLGEQISTALAANAAVADIAARLSAEWGALHSGSYFTDPAVSFLRSEIEGVLRYVTVEFAPGPDQPQVDFSLLSDGQKSLLYIALVLATQVVGREVLAGRLDAFDLERLRPPVFTLLAVEEPENSLSPHYLGRVLTALSGMAHEPDAQAVVATHSPSLMRRVDPEQVRYLRLDAERRTTVATVTMPAKSDEAHKFVREALHAYPELYFARLVVLGEGDSEEVVLPRCLRAVALEADATSISVVPLGGRHVNHFWRLLNGLGIPHVTLLDLDLGRYQGGWGRIKYAAGELLRLCPPGSIKLTQEQLDALSARTDDIRAAEGQKWLEWLETYGVFFSAPLDLDFMMLQAFPQVYGLVDADRQPSSPKVVAAVLGKRGDATSYREDEQALFDAYHHRFKLGSKPTQHVAALAELAEPILVANMPAAIRRLAERVGDVLSGLPE